MQSITVEDKTYTIGDDEQLVFTKCRFCGHHAFAVVIALPGYMVASEQVKELSCQKCGKKGVEEA